MSKKHFILLAIGLLTLTSCDLDITIGELFGSTSNTKVTTTQTTTNTPNTTNTSTLNPTTTTNSDSTSSSQGNFNNYYQETDTKYTLRDSNEGVYWYTLRSTGTQKVLVVPVHFSNAATWTNAKLENLNKIFFGSASDTNWESVSSYFAKSSYGNLNITGEIYDSIIEVGMTSSAFDQKYQSYMKGTTTTSYDPGEYIGNLFYNQTSSDILKEYDQDKDGFIDSIIYVYSNSYSMSSDSAYWAWVSSSPFSNNLSAPVPNVHMWVSYEFINNEYDAYSAPTGLDGHTFIHEMGHLLGLDDYYCYDESNAWDPAGELDMQSYNVGDHNIYSKLSLGWIDPYVVTGDADIKLRSSALYGDAILIKNNWNKTIFDEYIMIEYYTPEGLNEQDSLYAFDSRDKMYSQSGLRIYHVDARLVKLGYNDGYGKNSGYVKNSELSTIFDSTQYIAYIGASNSKTYSYLSSSQNPSKVRLLHLIDKGGNNTLDKGTGYHSNSVLVNRNSALWQQGDVFEATSSYFYQGNDTFNDGTKVGYTVEVKDTINGEITVSIRVK